MSEDVIATLESVLTDCYVVRVTQQDGKVAYLGLDALGTYMPPDLRAAHFLAPAQREEVMNSPFVKYWKEHGRVNWCRVALAVAD